MRLKTLRQPGTGENLLSCCQATVLPAIHHRTEVLFCFVFFLKKHHGFLIVSHSSRCWEHWGSILLSRSEQIGSALQEIMNRMPMGAIEKVYCHRQQDPGSHFSFEHIS
uniref:Uncharacterized protein n=1 Tax=Mus musculus TaxID=10090 RepID=Q3UMM9_MOUSE|nr:unnamed protein product [Mus musculus]